MKIVKWEKNNYYKYFLNLNRHKKNIMLRKKGMICLWRRRFRCCMVKRMGRSNYSIYSCVKICILNSYEIIQVIIIT